MESLKASRRRWLWAGGALLLSVLALAALGVMAVRWEAQARLEEQRMRAQGAAEILVDLVAEHLRAGNASQDVLDGLERKDWTPMPGPPTEVYEQYLRGEYEAVIGAGRGHFSPAGTPVQTLAALQLIRVEEDQSRLRELCEIAWAAGGFVLPSVMEEAEAKVKERGWPLPIVLAGWRDRWESRRLGILLSRRSWMGAETTESGQWVDAQHGRWWIRTGDELLALPEEGVQAAVARARELITLPEGTEAEVSVSGVKVTSVEEGESIAQGAGKEIAVRIAVVNHALLEDSDNERAWLLRGALATAGGAGVLAIWFALGAWRRERAVLERQSDFIAAVSHEMRTPLASMRLLASNLEREVVEEPEEKKEHAQLILEEMDRLSRMVERVLSFSRGGARRPLNLAPIDVTELIERAAAAVRPLAEQREVTLELAVQDDLEPMGEDDVLTEAALNLLDNAVKHSQQGGVVRLGMEARGENEWCLWVEDEGEGVPMGEREKVFDQFYRIGSELRRERPGSGLGLALVRQTVERHQGRVCCLAGANGGARFEWVLPMEPTRREREES